MNEDTMTLMLSGEVDHHSAAAMRKEADELIKNYRPKKLIMNFRGVNFCDSSGIALVLGRYKLVNEMGGTVSVVGASKPTERIFTMANMERFVNIER